MKADATPIKVKSLAVSPASVVIGSIGTKQQFAVTATYADGTTRDVTAETFLDSSNPEVATVDKAGLV